MCKMLSDIKILFIRVENSRLLYRMNGRREREMDLAKGNHSLIVGYVKYMKVEG